MLEWKDSVEELRDSFCRACGQKECQHSFAATTSTAKKVRKHEEMRKFRSPVIDETSLPIIAEQVNSASTVMDDEIQKLEDLKTEKRGDALVQLIPPPQDVTTADFNGIGAKLAAIRAAHAEVSPQVQEMEEPLPIKTEIPRLPVIPSVASEQDPWSLPLSHERSLDYTEKEAEDDPWSTEYKGARHIRANPGQKIILPGAKKK